MDIVLVDDEKLIVAGMKKIISGKYPDAQIRCFTDPVEALRDMRLHLPQLLITDIRMPQMNGLELVAEVRKLGLSNYAVLTGLDDVPLLQESIRLRVADYLIKPVNKSELFTLIDRVSEEIETRKKEEQLSLSTVFVNAACTDNEIAVRLKEQLSRSDCPPKTLQSFLTEAGRDVSFREICRLADELLHAEEDEKMETIGKKMREYPLFPTVTSPDVQYALQRIREEYSSELSLSEMAAKAFLQPNYYSTLFKKETGSNFVQFLNQYRINEACRIMLEHPGKSLMDVAVECGFSSDRNFFTAFKKYTDITPGQFREELLASGFIRKT